MRWDLEEKTEDALVAYLKATISGSIRVSAAWERDEMEFPAAVVHAESSEPVSEEAAWHDARSIAVSVAVISEGAHELGSNNAILTRARERNGLARSDVINALAVSDLNTQLIAQGVEDIAFSMAQFTRCERATEGRYLVSTLTVEVVAEPVTGS